MITSKDYLANSRYKIAGVFSIKVHPSGAVLREEKVFTQYLNSEAGVILWLKEQTPFKEVQVFDLNIKRDITKEIIDKCNGNA